MVQTSPRSVGSTRHPAAPHRQHPMFGFTGILVALVVASNLGLPLPGAHLAIDALLVTIGFDLARAVRRSGKQQQWLAHFWLTTGARILVPLAVALGLVALYWQWQGQLDESKVAALLGAVSMTLNILAFSDQARVMAIEHLWLIGAVGQFAIALPILVAGAKRYFGAERRTAVLIGLGVGVAISRLGLLLTSSAGTETISTFTRLDGLLIGAAIGVCPLATLRSRIPLQLASVSFACLLLLLVIAPNPQEMPVLSLGLLSPVAVVLAALVATASAVGGSRTALADILDIHLLRWLGDRVFSIYIWHSLFGFTLDSEGFATGQAMHEWPGASVFVVRIVFSLAVASASHRYLVEPAVMAAEQFMQRFGRKSSGPTAGGGQRQEFRQQAQTQQRNPQNPGPYSAPHVRSMPITLSNIAPLQLRSLTSKPPSLFEH